MSDTYGNYQFIAFGNLFTKSGDMDNIAIQIDDFVIFQCADGGFFEDQDEALNNSFTVTCQTGGVYPSITDYPVCTTRKECIDPYNHTVPNLVVSNVSTPQPNGKFVYQDEIK